MSIFDRFNDEIDVQGLVEDVINASNNSGSTYEEVTHGSYEVKVEKLEGKVSKSGKPMLSIWFKIIAGDKFKGSIIFYNQVLTTGFGIHLANEMMKKLTRNELDEIEFKDFSQYEELMETVFEYIQNRKYEYALKYSANEKNPKFNNYEIMEVFED